VLTRVLTQYSKERQINCPSCKAPFWCNWRELKYGLSCPACDRPLVWDEKGLHVSKYYFRAKKGRYAPEFIRSYFNELEQHGVPFRTRMQWLSRNYGGKGGYTSEELYKIATGKGVDSYYIYPFVKNAPPEVNRILEQTYRTRRKAGASKKVAGIIAWKKVRKAGYVQEKRMQPVWVKKR